MDDPTDPEKRAPQILPLQLDREKPTTIHFDKPKQLSLRITTDGGMIIEMPLTPHGDVKITPGRRADAKFDLFADDLQRDLHLIKAGPDGGDDR